MKTWLNTLLFLFFSLGLQQNVLALDLHHIKHMVIFGDSLSDAGYMDKSAPHFLPKGKCPTYTSLHGHVWGYYLAKELGVPFSANNLNPPINNKWISGKLSGNDYAAGGARAPDNVLGYGYKDDYNPPSLQWQIQQFLQQHHGKAPADAIYFIWIGANDILVPALEKHAFKTLSSINNSVHTIAAEIIVLQHAGAKHIIVINIPPLGDSPLMNNSWLSRTIGNLLSKFFNHKLTAALQQRDVDVPLFDANNIFNTIYETVRQHNIFRYQNISITNVTDSGCLPHHYMANKTNIAINCVAPPEINMSHYMFADLVHPSDSGHILLAHYLLDYLKQLPN